MSDRTAIMLVDTGFLANALVLQFGRSKRSEISITYESLCEVLKALAEEETNSRLLRQTWYDAARGRRPTAEHRALNALAGVHVRLGWIVDTSNGPAQKAVDTAIVRDLVIAANRKVADELVLIAGDGDLVPGVSEAVESGLKVHLWGVSVDDPRVRQSNELVALADQRLTIDLADFEPHIRSVDGRGERTSKGAEQPRSEAASDEERDLETVDVDSTSVVLDLPASPPSADARLGPPPLSRLANADTVAEWLRADMLEPMRPQTFGNRYGHRWLTYADESMRSRLRDVVQPPQLPRLLEADMSKSASDLGLDGEDQSVRHGLRAGFWEAVDTLGIAERPSD